MAQRPDPTLVSTETFRRLVDAAPGEIEALIRAGTIQRAGPGLVALIPATRAFIERTKAQTRNASLAAAQDAAKAARAEAAELALMVERREMVADADAQAALDHLAGTITTACACLPARATRDLRARTAMDAVLRSVQEAIVDDLMEQSA